MNAFSKILGVLMLFTSLSAFAAGGSGEGGGSSNGDNNIASKMDAPAGLDDFHRALYLFSMGVPPTQKDVIPDYNSGARDGHMVWQGVVLGNLKNGLQEQPDSMTFPIGYEQTGNLGGRFFIFNTNITAQLDQEGKSLVASSDGHDYSMRLYRGDLIAVEYAKKDNCLYGYLIPVEGVCVIHYLYQKTRN